jgi:hypothetical protein
MKLNKFTRCIACAVILTMSAMGEAADWGTAPTNGVLADRVAFNADQKIFDSKGWPLRKPLEKWTAAANMVQSDAVWARWVKDRKAAVDDWMQKRSDRSDRIVGWLHDYVNADGSSRAWRVDEEPVEDSSTPSGRKLHEAWNFTFRQMNIDRVLEAARLFRLTGEYRYAAWAAGQLDFYADNYSKWPLQKRQGFSRLMGQSLDEATVSMRLVDTARLLTDFAPKAQQAKWASLLFIPIADSLEQSYNGVNNISCWQRSAMAVIALHVGDEAMFARATEGPNGLRQLIQSGVNADAMWYEGSMGYNAYVVRALLPFFEADMRADRGEAFAPEMVQIQNMMLVPMALRFPDNSLPNPSDNVGRLRAPDTSILLESRRVLPTQIGASFAMARRSWEQLIDPVLNVDKVAPLPQVVSRVLPTSQMAVLKSSQWQVFSHWGQSVVYHAQREALNLEVFVGDEPLTRDPGTTFYGSPLHANYYTQPAAHNVPFADDKGQLGWAPGALESFDAATSTLNVAQAQYNANLSAKRSSQLLGATFVDELALSPKVGVAPPKTVGATWHFDCAVSGPDALQTSVATFPNIEGFQYWTDVQAMSAHDAVTVALKCGQRTVNLKIEVAGEFTLFKANAPGFPPEKRVAVYVRKNASNAIIRSSFTLTN